MNDSERVTHIMERRLLARIRFLERSYWLIPPEDREGDLVAFVALGLLEHGWRGRGYLLERPEAQTGPAAVTRLRDAIRACLVATWSEHGPRADSQAEVARHLIADGWREIL